MLFLCIHLLFKCFHDSRYSVLYINRPIVLWYVPQKGSIWTFFLTKPDSVLIFSSKVYIHYKCAHVNHLTHLSRLRPTTAEFSVLLICVYCLLCLFFFFHFRVQDIYKTDFNMLVERANRSMNSVFHFPKSFNIPYFVALISSVSKNLHIELCIHQSTWNDECLEIDR